MKKLKEVKGRLKDHGLYPTSARRFHLEDEHGRVAVPHGVKHGVSPLATAPVVLLDPHVVRQVESLSLEQQTLIRELRQFARDVDGGAERDAVLCGDAFRSALARLTSAQQQQRELLEVARAQITRDHPMLLQQSRQLLELLSSVTTEAEPAAPVVRWTEDNPPPPPPRPEEEARTVAPLIEF